MRNFKPVRPSSITVLSGAGISAESGLKTFRDSGGLWEGHNVQDVATPEAWHRNQAQVLKFYNERRRNVSSAEPNDAHLVLAELEKFAQVQIITQNIDNLHEQAGSTNVLHLHGEITKARSSGDENYVIDIGFRDLEEGEMCPSGFQLRPHIVWFGEPVPKIVDASEVAMRSEIMIVVGTSLEVYPAAGLVNYIGDSTPLILVDPGNVSVYGSLQSRMRHYRENAGSGLRKALIDLGFDL